MFDKVSRFCAYSPPSVVIKFLIGTGIWYSDAWEFCIKYPFVSTPFFSYTNEINLNIQNWRIGHKVQNNWHNAMPRSKREKKCIWIVNNFCYSNCNQSSLDSLCSILTKNVPGSPAKLYTSWIFSSFIFISDHHFYLQWSLTVHDRIKSKIFMFNTFCQKKKTFLSSYWPNNMQKMDFFSWSVSLPNSNSCWKDCWFKSQYPILSIIFSLFNFFCYRIFFFAPHFCAPGVLRNSKWNESALFFRLVAIDSHFISTWFHFHWFHVCVARLSILKRDSKTSDMDQSEHSFNFSIKFADFFLYLSGFFFSYI